MVYSITNRPTHCPECNSTQCLKHYIDFECPFCKKIRKLKVTTISLRPTRENATGACRSCARREHYKIDGAKEKLSESLKGKNAGRVQTKEEKEKRGASNRKAYQEGRREPITMRSKQIWMHYADGTRFWVQGTYEQRYAQSLLDNNVDFIAHPKALSFLDKAGKKRTYFPDFFITQNNEYIDVKSDYTLELAGESYWDKIQAVMEQNKVIVQTIILFKGDL